MIIGKVYNCRWVLERAKRDHSLQVNLKEIQRIAFLFSTVEPEKKPKHIEIYQEAKNDPRNPFD